MKYFFEEEAQHSTNKAFLSDCLKNLPDRIYKHTYLQYSYKQTDKGCFLKPIFRNMPYRNDFVPEIDIIVSHEDARTILNIKGKPRALVRVFMAFWFSFLLVFGICVLLLAITSKLDSFLPLIVPIIMWVFGYLLCKISTKKAFQSVVKAIQKEI